MCSDVDKGKSTVRGYPKNMESDVLNPYLRLSKRLHSPTFGTQKDPELGPKKEEHRGCIEQ